MLIKRSSSKSRLRNGPRPGNRAERFSSPNVAHAKNLPGNPVTKRGDLWILGEHRLLCGDAGNPADVDRLLEGIGSVQLVHTDPPYNVNVQPRSAAAIAASPRGKKRAAGQRSRKLAARDRVLANDCLPEKEFTAVLLKWFGEIGRVLEPGRAFYIWGGYANSSKYPSAMTAHGLRFAQAIIWVKDCPVLTRKDFMGAHEWCFYGWKQGSAHKYFGPKNARDVWYAKRVPWQRRLHLTEKPVELAKNAIEYSTQPGEGVLDLFAGSGSTMAAAQQTGRRAYCMEIDALYCDVIVERWKRFSGSDPERRSLKKAMQ